MGGAFSARRTITRQYCGYGLCVATKHAVLIASDHEPRLYVYSMIDGTMIRTIGSTGGDKGQVNTDWGGICVSLDGDSVLIADYGNDCVQEMRIADGSWVRFAGVGMLKCPRFVDCNADAIAISETDSNRITVLSWADGSLRAQFGSYGNGPGHLNWPCGIRMLADGSGLVVTDLWNDRLCVFTLSGEFVAAVGSAEQGLSCPCDVLDCAPDASFAIANWGNADLVEIRQANDVTAGVYSRPVSGYNDVHRFSTLAALRNGGCIVADYASLQQIMCYRGRLAWMRACTRTRAHVPNNKAGLL